MDVVFGHLGTLLEGFRTTLELTVVGYVGALLLGIVLAVCRVGPIPPLRLLGTVYVEFFRNIPLLTLLVLFVFGLPDVGVQYSLFGSAATCLILSGAAFVCEAMRAGINTVSVGQAEAARAIGLTFSQTLLHVVLPQALRTMVQPLVNIFIGTVLGTSLVAVVGVSDLTNRYQFLTLQYAEGIPLVLAAGVLYIVVNLGAGAAGTVLERRLAVRR
jgi:glutamate transport system permease protein